MLIFETQPFGGKESCFSHDSDRHRFETGLSCQWRLFCFVFLSQGFIVYPRLVQILKQFSCLTQSSEYCNYGHVRGIQCIQSLCMSQPITCFYLSTISPIFLSLQSAEFAGVHKTPSAFQSLQMRQFIILISQPPCFLSDAVEPPKLHMPRFSLLGQGVSTCFKRFYHLAQSCFFFSV